MKLQSLNKLSIECFSIATAGLCLCIPSLACALERPSGIHRDSIPMKVELIPSSHQSLSAARTFLSNRASSNQTPSKLIAKEKKLVAEFRVKSSATPGISGVMIDIPGLVNNGTDLLQQTNEGAKWQFFDDGTFLYTPVGIGTQVSQDLYPLSGSYTFKDGVYKLKGKKSFSNAEYYESIIITGSIKLDGNKSALANLTEETTKIKTSGNNGNSNQSQTSSSISYTQEMERLK